MTSRDLVLESLHFASSGRIPRHCWVLPWAEERYPEAVSSLRSRYPDDVVSAPVVYENSSRNPQDRYRKGTYTDEWGCVFHNLDSGIIGLVKNPLIAQWEDLEGFRTPESVLHPDRNAVRAFCRSTDRFVVNGCLIRPFERLQFLRTMEQAMIDLAEQPPELFALLERIHAHYLKEAEAWSATEIDALYLMDDWGFQQGMTVSPALFRRIFKPMYREYVEIAHSAGKKVFMHSDGAILDIIPDLIDIGVDALNCQVFCMGAEALARFRGELTFWGEIDRQRLLPYGTRQEIRAAVQTLYDALYCNGGIIAQCEFGPGARPENVLAVFEAWNGLSPSNEG